ncbi:zinc finger CCCH domain-containing protein [Arthroderma uncinatum]|uniref:zinc finger CCCH domain-containing protein n=1 Tax=Arthroderma uncinatum TaxID=74035 RepID=UPI00144A7469|nr:zinc finger CCCH domain-containing protein [Arthroderma uncinatum]KAF3480829.1 zinc finger CCCH domain-containing protein [Arthroderma uncinatum]
MTEEEELLAKIGQLAGQINQHKNQSNPATRGGHSGAPYARHARGGWRPYRGRARGASRALAGPHRNRTLVLNSQSTPSDPASSVASPYASTDETSDAKQGTNNAWVAKRDRHMQLINSSIFNQETQARNKAIAETRRLKEQKKAEREESMVLRHAQSATHFPESSKIAQQSDRRTYTILVGDTPFQVAQGGSKLVSLSSTCFKGPTCPYIHDPNKVAICKEFLQTDNLAEGESDEDVSSDEEVYDEIDTDDVDSDDLEGTEEITQGVDGGDASQQLDFIGFS